MGFKEAINKRYNTMDKKIDKREFIKDASLLGLGLALGLTLINMSANNSTAEQSISKLVISSHIDAVKDMKLNPDAVNKIVDKAVTQFTGQNNVSDAWASVLNPFSPNDVVAIKVNCINASLPTHPEVVDAIVAGLILAGVKPNNIIIWDRKNNELARCRYKINTSKTGVRCFGTDENGWGYDKQVNLAGKDVRLSKILTSCDHLINVPVLKDHATAGVTLSMKNHYGSVDNPSSLHGSILRIMSCDPYIAELNNVPDIKDKTRFILVDSLIGTYKGGPNGRPQFVTNSVLVGKDPVAVDHRGWEMIKSERQQKGIGMSYPAHIKTAAKMELGTNDPANMRIKVVEAKI